MTGWSHGSRAAWPVQWSLLRFSPVTSFWPIEAGAQPIQICARLHTARAGSVSIGLLLVHSVVDYPLRTTALSVMVAISCAFMLRAASC